MAKISSFVCHAIHFKNRETRSFADQYIICDDESRRDHYYTMITTGQDPVAQEQVARVTLWIDVEEIEEE